MGSGRSRVESVSEIQQSIMVNEMADQIRKLRQPIQDQIDYLVANGGSKEEIAELRKNLEKLIIPLCDLIATS